MPEAKETEVIKIRLSSITKEKIQEEAEKEYRSFAKQCQMILDEWVARHEK